MRKKGNFWLHKTLTAFDEEILDSSAAYGANFIA